MLADQVNSFVLPMKSQPCLEATVPEPLAHQHRFHEDFSRASPTNFFLDIFSGASMPVSTALSKLFGDRVQPIDLIHGHDLLHDDTFEDVLRLAASGLIGAALAAPYCSKQSKATLKSPGQPLRALLTSLTGSYRIHHSSSWLSRKALLFMIAPEHCFRK